MQNILLNKLKKREITKMDAIIYLLIEKYPYKSRSEYCLLCGFPLATLGISINKLVEKELIDETKEKPARYYIK